MWPDYASSACVCKRSLAVHCCGDDCTISPRKMNDGEGGFVCPLSNIVVRGCDAVAVPIFNADGACVNHWSKHRRVGPRRTVRRTPSCRYKPSTCEAVMMSVLCGDVKGRVRDVQTQRAQRSVEKTMKRKRRDSPNECNSFHELRRVVRAARQRISPPCRPDDVRVHVREIAKDVCAYMRTHSDAMTASAEVAACTWLTLLSTGLTCGAIQVVPRDPVVAANMIPPPTVSMVPKVQCRAVSVAVRRFKRSVFTPDGGAIHSRVFAIGAAAAPRKAGAVEP